MTEGIRRCCRVVSVAFLLAGVLNANGYAMNAMEKDARAVKALELSHWTCTRTSAESCSVKIRGIAIADTYALVDWITTNSGGGSMAARDLENYGVPHGVALELLETREVHSR